MTIKFISKPIDTSKQRKIAQKDADRAFQEWGRSRFSLCLVCGKPYSCLHHYFPKSTSTALRYSEANAIPLCAGCHCQHHHGNPEIHNTINRKMGAEWLNNLRIAKQEKVKPTIVWYREKENYFLMKIQCRN